MCCCGFLRPAFLGILSVAATLRADPAAPPNIVLIVADDLGIELGCYGDPQVSTPNIDRLASDGVRFETAWVTAASCSPSRGSIHTGLYPHQNGLTGLAHHGFAFNRPYPTIASILHERGYRTAVIGKFHVAPEDVIPWDFKFTPEFHRDVLGDQRDVRTMALIADGIIAGNTGPFFLMMSYIDPHVPLFDQRLGLPAEPRSAAETEPFPFSAYDSPALRERTAAYLNCISRLDTGVGLLLEALERHGKLANTLVIFIGDHGAPFARAKNSSYDRGLRIPMIFSGPGLIAKARVSSQLVSTVDLLPTIADAAGVVSPSGLPGRSLLPLLRGDQRDDEEGYLFASYFAHQRDAVYPARAIRDQRYLLIENLRPSKPRPRAEVDGCEIWPAEGGVPLPIVDVESVYATYRHPPRTELYDLVSDPSCFENLADDEAHADQRAILAQQLDRWRRATTDPMLTESVDDKGSSM